MADAGAGRHDAEILERLLAPAQERVALAVAVIFHVDVLREGVRRAEEIHHHRMVDDEIDRDLRVDALRVAAEMRGGVAHRGEVDDGRHAGEILHQHARRPKGDLAVRAALLEPRRDGADVVGGDAPPVLEAEQVFEQHLEREGEAGNAREPVLLRFRKREIGVGLAADVERAAAFERVEGWLGQGLLLLRTRHHRRRLQVRSPEQPAGRSACRAGLPRI